MAELLEITMIVCFGISWPLNVLKSIKAKTAKGKSLFFLIMIFLGYIAGITAKLINPIYMAQFSEKWYVLFFYVLNLLMVSADVVMYFINLRRDKLAEKKKS